MADTLYGGLVLNLYTFFLAVMLLLFQENDKKSRSNKSFMTLVAFLAFLTGVSIMGDVGNIKGGNLFFLTKLSTYCVFAFDPLGFIFSVNYISNFTTGIDKSKIKRFSVPMYVYAFINFALVTVSEILDKDWFYFFAANEYYRGSLYLVRGLFHVVLCVSVIGFVFYLRKNIIPDYRKPIISFPLLVGIGGLLQVLLFGINLEYAATVFACLGLFIYVQKRDVNRDYLTGILNRRGIDIALNNAITESKEKKFAAIMIDVDYFKAINDKFGHKAGDEVLENIAGVLMSSFDENDCVGRLGGDEFFVITKVNDNRELNKRIERLKNSVASLDWSNKGQIDLSVSTGAAVYEHSSGMKVKDFLEHIDKRMYEEKEKHHSVLLSS